MRTMFIVKTIIYLYLMVKQYICLLIICESLHTRWRILYIILLNSLCQTRGTKYRQQRVQLIISILFLDNNMTEQFQSKPSVEYFSKRFSGCFQRRPLLPNLSKISVSKKYIAHLQHMLIIYLFFCVFLLPPSVKINCVLNVDYLLPGWLKGDRARKIR